ncbi:hypothetical protein LPB140_04800 [Sphingorhabdus lutea]|uniref:Cell wall hydrolase SleB domain-containing protein n=1 Tax=Sphingorhabdus lutea TaxID=1913578 RepID=A0A1L3JEN3_9SPHN|nr:hypothetical protein LPB140_04800 [Sphingorhabdus lutea]
MGAREIIIILIAVTLLSLYPSAAQWVENRDSVNLQNIDVTLDSAEKADENFPGSAFYFQQQEEIKTALQAPSDPYLEANVTDYQSAAAAELTGLYSSSGLAPKFNIAAGSVDYSRALRCLTDAIYYEAATEPEVGQLAVAQVILNRVRHPAYPNNVCGVVYQGSERATGCQFSYSCDGSMARRPSAVFWNRAQKVAASALAGRVLPQVGTATHYHTTAIYPYWAPSLDFIGVIGAHRFYRWKGSAGRPTAFFRRYAGAEPFPGPKPRAFTPVQKDLDPIKLQASFEKEYALAKAKAELEAAKNIKATQSAQLRGMDGNIGISPALSNPRAVATPKYDTPNYSNAAKKAGGETRFKADKLPSNGNIKAEYQQSGTWKQAPSGN